jgi:SAM-dependent methyltransferase
MGAAYLRYSFTKGTTQEVDALEELLGLQAGCSILDVGCGPGRHSLELARRGYRVTGLDISETFVEIARSSARGEGLDVDFVRHDARDLPAQWKAGFDAVICLCQGGFGLMLERDDDERVFSGLVECLRGGGRLAVSAFNAYFAVKHFTESSFDAARGINVEETEVRDAAGKPLATKLWTGCYTPRELTLMARLAGLEGVEIHGVEPGAYGRGAPSVDLAEFLLVAERSAEMHW